MARYELIRFPDDDSLAREVAERWLPRVKSPYMAAFSGGRITVKFFHALARHPLRGALKAAGVHFFFADERCVPPDHPDSNFRLVHEHLIQTSVISLAQVHRIPAENPPEAAARDASKEIQDLCPHSDDGLPILDMIFLGMGEDGHVASLFPGDSFLDSPAIYRPVIAPKSPPERITIGLPVVLRARDAWAVIAGAGKEAALSQSLNPDGTTPLGHVLRGRGHTSIFTDIR